MMDMIFYFKVGSVLVIACYVWSWILKRYKLIRDLSWMSGPPALPILGNTFELMKTDQTSIIQTLNNWKEKYGNALIYWVGPDPVILVSDPEIIHRLANVGKFSDKSIEYKFLECYLGHTTLLTAKGEIWYFKRRLLDPCFHNQILESFIDSMNSHAEGVVKYLNKFANNKDSFNFLTVSKLVTLEILMDTTMGRKVSLLENDDNEYLRAIEKVRQIIMTRSYSIFLRNEFLFKFSKMKKEGDLAAATIRAFVNQVIMSRREERRTQNINDVTKKKGRKAILDMFLDMVDAGNSIPDDDIENEINTFIFAGHDTTSVALSFTLYLLGRHPDIQQKVYDELRENVPDYLNTGLTQSNINQLDLLNRCIKESLRVFSAVPLIGKMLHEPLQTEKGVIPSGINISENIYSLHTNEDIYPNPHAFDPDRFLPENIAKRVPHSYIPFASGMRNCIGQRFAIMEIKILLCHILGKYQIEAIDAPEDLQLAFDIVLTPKKGINLKLKNRVTK